MSKTMKAATAAKPTGVLPFADTIAIFTKCIDIFGDEDLRGGNFPPYMAIEPMAFDVEDQRVALQHYVDAINAVDDCDTAINELRSKLQGYFGPIDRPFTAVLRGWTVRIVPQVCLH